MAIGGAHGGDVFAAADVHYLPCGGARAAVVLAADAAFSVVVEEMTATVPVLRGRSARPLYITAAGMPVKEAADLVIHMAGPFRRPDALRRVDVLARTGQWPG